MSQETLVRAAFNAGELSPRALGRSDLKAYSAGLSRCENWVPLAAGALTRRPGARFAGVCLDASRASRLLPFVFGRSDAVVVEMAPGRLRILADGTNGPGAVLAPTLTLRTAASVNVTTDEIVTDGHGLHHGSGPIVLGATAPNVPPNPLTDGASYYAVLPQTVVASAVDAVADTLTATAHGLSDQMGPWHVASSREIPGGLSESTIYYVHVVDANTLQLALTPGGAAVDITTAGTGVLTLEPDPLWRATRLRLSTTSGGMALDLTTTGTGEITLTPPADNLILEHPYDATEIWDVQAAQSADRVILCHERHPPMALERHGPYAWTFEPLPLEDGPYQAVNATDETLVASGTTGIVDLTSSKKGAFEGMAVGTPVRLGKDDGANQWGWGRIVGFTSDLQITQSDLETYSAAIKNATGPYNILPIGTHSLQSGDGPFFLSYERKPIDQDGYEDQATPNYVLAAPTMAPMWVHRVDSTQVTLHPSEATAISGTSSYRLVYVDPNYRGYGNGNDVLTITNSRLHVASHGLADGFGPVSVSSTGKLAAGLESNRSYWVEVEDGDHIYLRASVSGARVPLSVAGMTGLMALHGITGSSDAVRLLVRRTLPTTAITKFWRLGAFGTNRGWPSAVALFQQRLLLAGTREEPSTIYGSATGDLSVFSPDSVDDQATAPSELIRVVADDSGFTFRLASEQPARIRWLTSLRTLVAGTDSGIWTVSASSFLEALTPTNVSARRSGASTGASAGRPVALASALAYLSATSRKILVGTYDPGSESFTATRADVLADHVLQPSARLDGYADEPWSSLLLVRSDGELVLFVIDVEQKVLAACRQTMGGSGLVRSATALLQNDGRADAIWVTVERSLAGKTEATIEVIGPPPDDADGITDARNLDSWVRATGTDLTTISNLGHLEGLSVWALADGAVQGPFTVSGGQITLDTAADDVVVGVAYTSRAVLTVPEPSADVTLSLRTTRVVDATARLVHTLGLQAGPEDGPWERVQLRAADAPMDVPTAPFTGTVSLMPMAPYGIDERLELRVTEPLPATVAALGLRLEWGQR